MSKARWPTERKVIALLTATVALILMLIGLLTHSWGWSWLSIASVMLASCMVLSWLAWRCWHAWAAPLMSLVTYTQSLAAGESGIALAQRGRSVLLDDLSREINNLHTKAKLMNTEPLLPVMFRQLFDDLPVAVMVFDDSLCLSYANQAAHAIAEFSLLQGIPAARLGFVQSGKTLSHPALASNWRCQTSAVLHQQQAVTIFTAVDIATELKQSELAVQKNLVRVLSHELRNTLTPMASMADTLLCASQWHPDQVNQVLERIKARSEGMLNFVQRFAQVAKIPEPNITTFTVPAQVEQTRCLLRHQDSMQYTGQQNGVADAHLIGQVLMNLVKNAVESSPHQGVVIDICYYQAGNQQYLTVADSGPGFSNLDNALTPLFTTKVSGAGIGLAFVEAVMNKHSGRVELANQKEAGAKVTLSWPLHIG